MTVEEEYLSIRAVNWSTLKHMATSPLLCRYRSELPEKDKDAYRLGRALHVATLEPERWKSEYVIEPDFGPQYTVKGDIAANPKATKGYKDARDRWIASLKPGAMVIDPGEHALAVRCADAVRKHRISGPLLKGGRCEHTVKWVDPVTGVKCKGRLDLVHRCVVDLKGTTRQSVRQFLNDAANYLYFGQVAWYHSGAIQAGELPPDADYPIVIGVQTCEPFDVIPLRMLSETYDAGQRLFRQLLDRYVQCQQANWWPGLAEDFVPWELPAYAPGVEQQQEADAW